MASGTGSTASPGRRRAVPRTRREAAAREAPGGGAAVRPVQLLDAAFRQLSKFRPPAPSAPPDLGEPKRFDVCAPPSVRTPPQFQVPFRRPMIFPDLCLGVDVEGASPGDPDHPHPSFGA